jgi:hypothetical protein
VRLCAPPWRRLFNLGAELVLDNLQCPFALAMPSRAHERLRGLVGRPEFLKD